jgi:hypothetical protein
VAGAGCHGARERDVRLAPLRSALLLDVAGHGRLRRLAFGPEVSWGVRVREGEETIHELVPFTGGVVDLRAESRDGLHVAALALRAGSAVEVPGGAEGFAEGRATLERVTLAVNDRPLALYLSAAARAGPAGRGVEASVGLRAAVVRVRKGR